MNQQSAKHRVRSLMGRLLSSIENLFRCDLDDVRHDEKFELSGEDVLLIRNLILDACNDTIRSLPGKDRDIDFSFARDSFPIYKHAILEIHEDKVDDVLEPQITMRGDSKHIHDIRNKIGHGVVYYNNGQCFYTCLGLEDVVDYVIPFLDQARLARIVISNGNYPDWRESVVKIYRGEG